jgi:hypothetical protein
MNKSDIKWVACTLSIYFSFVLCLSVILGLILSLSISYIFKIDFDQDFLNLWIFRSIILVTATLLIKYFINRYKYRNKYYL